MAGLIALALYGAFVVFLMTLLDELGEWYYGRQ